MAGRNDERLRCSFCGKTQDQVRKLIAGPNGAYICDECVDVCAEIIDEELENDEFDGNQEEPAEQINLIKPEEMKAFLDEYDALAREMTDTTFGSQVYGAHYHTWRSAVQLFGVLDGKHTILDGNYDFFKPYYEMVLNQEADGVCRKYTDLKTEGLHYSAAFSGGDVAMMNMGSWFIATMMSNLKSGEYDSSLCGNWGIVKYPHAEGVEPGSTLGTITGLAVTTASDTPDASWDFVKWVSGEEGAAVMASSGNFPAMMTDEVVDMISGLEGFPTDEASKEALTVSNLYLEVPYAPNVSEINSALDSYHGSIMTGEMSIDDGIAAMNKAVADLQAQ